MYAYRVLAGVLPYRVGNEPRTAYRGTWLPDDVPLDLLPEMLRHRNVEPIDIEGFGDHVPDEPFLQTSTFLRPDSLDNMLSALRAAGVTDIPGVAEYDKLRPLMRSGPPRPPMPSRWLGLSSEGAADMLREQQYFDGTSRHRDTVILHREVNKEMAELLAQHGDQLVLQMRPMFDEAADKARELASLGVRSDDTAETLFDRAEAVREPWQEFRRTWAPQLGTVLEARKLLSIHTPYPPAIDGRHVENGQYFTDTPHREPIDWGVVVTNPAHAMPEGRPNWRWWLAVANDLHLTTHRDGAPQLTKLITETIPWEDDE